MATIYTMYHKRTYAKGRTAFNMLYLALAAGMDPRTRLCRVHNAQLKIFTISPEVITYRRLSCSH